MLGVVTTGLLIGMLSCGQVDKEMVIDSGFTFKVEATAYCNPNGNKTCTGRPTTENLTVATCKEWLGCTIYVWNEDMTEFYGIYESMDTGSHYKLKDGTCIDLYFEDKDECIDFGRRNVTIQVVRGKG